MIFGANIIQELPMRLILSPNSYVVVRGTGRVDIILTRPMTSFSPLPRQVAEPNRRAPLYESWAGVSSRFVAGRDE